MKVVLLTSNHFYWQTRPHVVLKPENNQQRLLRNFLKVALRKLSCWFICRSNNQHFLFCEKIWQRFSSHSNTAAVERAMKACLRLLCVSLCTILRLVHGNVIPMGIPWETSYGMGRGRHKLLWDGNGTNKYVPWTTLEILMKLRCLSLNISANKLYGQKSGDCDFSAFRICVGYIASLRIYVLR